MQANATESTPKSPAAVASIRHRRASYQKVFDGRKRRVRGLWIRNGAYYLQITITEPATGAKSVRRVRLEDKNGAPLGTLPQAVDAMRALQVDRARHGSLPIQPKRSGTLAETAEAYLATITTVATKTPKSIKTERERLAQVCKRLGELRLTQLTSKAITGYQLQRKAGGTGNRTVDLDIIVIRNVLKFAVAQGQLHSLPFSSEQIPKLTRGDPPKARLLTWGEIEHLCRTAMSTVRNGEQLSDLVKILALSGCRLQEGLALRWSVGGSAFPLVTPSSPFPPVSRSPRPRFAPSLHPFFIS